MDKSQAIHNFWAGFGLDAYDEATIPTGDKSPQMPYITYHEATDSIGNVIALTASLWYRSTSWAEISQKAEEIAQAIVEMYPPSIPLNRGRLYLSKGTPFTQRMTDPDDMVRRIFINVQAEFLTAF